MTYNPPKKVNRIKEKIDWIYNKSFWFISKIALEIYHFAFIAVSYGFSESYR